MDDDNKLLHSFLAYSHSLYNTSGDKMPKITPICESSQRKVLKVKLLTQKDDPFCGMRVVIVRNEEHFAREMFDARNQLTVVVFIAPWGLPCPKVAARFKVLSAMFHKARFLKVDTEKCQKIANILNINRTPAFVLYKNQNLLEHIRSPDMKSLELFIAVHYGEPV